MPMPAAMASWEEAISAGRALDADPRPNRRGRSRTGSTSAWTLPAPFSPMMPWIVPRHHAQRDVAVGPHRAEGLGDADELDGGGRGPVGRHRSPRTPPAIAETSPSERITTSVQPPPSTDLPTTLDCRGGSAVAVDDLTHGPISDLRPAAGGAAIAPGPPPRLEVRGDPDRRGVLSRVPPAVEMPLVRSRHRGAGGQATGEDGGRCAQQPASVHGTPPLCLAGAVRGRPVSRPGRLARVRGQALSVV